MNLMLVRLGLDHAEAQIDLSSTDGGTDDGCGGGFWCPACRAEIRAEAFAWLHALSEAYPMGPGLQSPWRGHEESEPAAARRPAPAAPRPAPADWPVPRRNGVFEIDLDPDALVREP